MQGKQQPNQRKNARENSIAIITNEIGAFNLGNTFQEFTDPDNHRFREGAHGRLMVPLRTTLSASHSSAIRPSAVEQSGYPINVWDDDTEQFKGFDSWIVHNQARVVFNTTGGEGNDTLHLAGCADDYNLAFDGNNDVVIIGSDGTKASIDNVENVSVASETFTIEEVVAYADEIGAPDIAYNAGMYGSAGSDHIV